MSFFGMHDAPSGNSSRTENYMVFKNNYGEDLKYGDKKHFRHAWAFLNPVLEREMHTRGLFHKDFSEIKNDLRKCIEENIEYMKLHSGLEKELKFTESMYKYLKNPRSNTLSQAYMSSNLKNGDIVYLRGKKRGVAKGAIFKVCDQDVIKYKNYEYKPVDEAEEPHKILTFVKFVSDENYKKLEAKNGSFWKLRASDIEIIERELDVQFDWY